MAVLLAHQAVENPATVVGSDVTVGRFDEVRVECYHAFNEAGANTNPQSFLVQTSVSTSGDEDWVTAVEFPTSTGTPSDEVVTVSGVGGATSLDVAATAGFVAGDQVYIRDTVATDSEWALVESFVSNDSIQFVDGLKNAHALTTTTIFGSAEKFPARMNVKAIQRVRCLYMNEALTASMNTHIKAVIHLIETGN